MRQRRDVPSRRPRELVARISLPQGVTLGKLTLDVNDRLLVLSEGATGRELLVRDGRHVALACVALPAVSLRAA
jgi:hypothetical protein